MPNIREFTSDVNTIRPSETGIDAVAQGARRIGALHSAAAGELSTAGRDIGSGIKAAGDAAVDFITHKEISAGAPKFANLQDTLTQQWNDIASKADPNDPSVAQKFREQVLEPSLESYRDNFNTENGQRWAETRIDSLRNYMFTKTAADMSSLAAHAVSVNMTQTANSMSNTAMLDPTSVPHLLETSDGMVDGIVSSAPNLKGEPAARARMELTQKMKEAIVKAGAQGAITRAADPEAEAAKWGEKYPEYISGQDLKTLAGNARSEIRARNYDIETARRRDKEVAQDKSTEAFNQYYIDVRSGDPQKVQDLAQKALHDPTLTKADKGSLFRLIDRELKPETDAKISAQTAVGLFRQIADPNADPAKVRQAIIDARSKDPGTPGSLSKADYDDAMKNLADLKTPEGQALASERHEFIKRYSIVVGGKDYGYGLKTEQGEVNLYRLEKDALRMERDLKVRGQDPHSLYDPASPNFLGKPANLSRYQVTMQQQLQQPPTAKESSVGDIISIDRQNTKFNPPPDWKYSPSRNQYRSPDGKLYDINGQPVI